MEKSKDNHWNVGSFPDLVGEDGDDMEEYVLQGLSVDEVRTARKYRRMGVATALFNSYEKYAFELMGGMERHYQMVGLALGCVQWQPDKLWDSTDRWGFNSSRGEMMKVIQADRS